MLHLIIICNYYPLKNQLSWLYYLTIEKRLGFLFKNHEKGEIIIMKKSSLLASLASLALLASCAKTVTFAEAKQHAADNYTLAAINEKYSGGTYKSVTDVKKSEGIFETKFKVGKDEDSGSAALTPFVPLSDSFTYKIDGKKMVVSYKLNAKDVLEESGQKVPEGAELKGTASGNYYYNEVGLITKSSEKCDISFSYSVAGVSVSGALKMSETVTYSYTTK